MVLCDRCRTSQKPYLCRLALLVMLLAAWPAVCEQRYQTTSAPTTHTERPLQQLGPVNLELSVARLSPLEHHQLAPYQAPASQEQKSPVRSLLQQSAADRHASSQFESLGTSNPAATDTRPRDLLLRKQPEVWLYSLLAADYEGAALLPHFLDHYLKLGVRRDRMLFIINSNPAHADVPRGGLATLSAILDSYGVDYTRWLGQYSADAHLKLKLKALQRVPVQDWIIIADSDEFQEYSTHTAAEFLSQADAAGANWVKGMFLDRVALNGSLAPVRPQPAIWEQFPLACDIARRLAHAEPLKVAAFKGFLRSGVGNHGIIPAVAARHYFGPAKPGEESARYGLCGAEDLYSLTPYYAHHQYYRVTAAQTNPHLWEAVEAQTMVKVHHFKWHKGVERSVRDRLAHYRGDDEACVVGQPRFKFWRESERLMKAITSQGRVDVASLQLKCHRVDATHKFQGKPAQHT